MLTKLIRHLRRELDPELTKLREVEAVARRRQQALRAEAERAGGLFDPILGKWIFYDDAKW